MIYELNLRLIFIYKSVGIRIHLASFNNTMCYYLLIYK